MMALFKFIVFSGILISIMASVSYLCRHVAKRFNVNVKILTQVVYFIIFLICSYLWSFTELYERLSKITFIPLEK